MPETTDYRTRHEISFTWDWTARDVVDLAIDGLFLDEYESDDVFVAVRDALTEWLSANDGTDAP